MPQTDPQTGSSLVTVYYPDGGERDFRRISPLDWIQLGNLLVATRKQRCRADHQAAGADKATLDAALSDVDRRPVRYADVRDFAETAEGSYYVLRVAVRQDAPDLTDKEAEAEIAKLGHPRGWLSVAAALCGLKTEVMKEGDPDSPPAGDGVTAPPPPEGPKPTSTGTSSGTESGSGSDAPTTP